MNNQHGSDQRQIQTILQENIKTLCSNWLNHDQKFTVQGLLGITIDDKSIILVNINESVINQKGSKQDSRTEYYAQEDKVKINGFSPAKDIRDKFETKAKKEPSQYSQTSSDLQVSQKTSDFVPENPTKSEPSNQINKAPNISPQVPKRPPVSQLDLRHVPNTKACEASLKYTDTGDANSSTVQNHDLNKNDKTYWSKQWPLISDILDNAQCMDLSKKSQTLKNVPCCNKSKLQMLEPNILSSDEENKAIPGSKRKSQGDINQWNSTSAEQDRSVKKSKNENGLHFSAHTTHKSWETLSEKPYVDYPMHARDKKISEPSRSNSSPSHSLLPYSQQKSYRQASDSEYPLIKSEYEPKQHVQKMTAPMMKMAKGKSAAGSSHRKSHGELDKLAAQVLV